MFAAQTEQRANRQPHTSRPGARRIVVVDDNRDNRDLFCIVLEGAGYDVTPAADGDIAVRLIEANPPDLVVLDLMMPNMNGYQVTEIIKSNPNLPFIPIIIITAKHELQDKVKGLELGVDDYLVKPVNYPELLARVKSLLRLKQAQDSLVAARNRLALLYDISNNLNTSLDIDIILARTLELTVKQLDASTGSIMLLDEDRRVLRHLLSRRDMPAEEKVSVVNKVINYGLGGWVALHGVGAIIEDTDEDSRWIHFKDDTVRAGSAMAVPMVNEERVGGLITLVHPHKRHFRAEHLELLTAISSQVMIAARNAQTHTVAVEEKNRTEAIISNLAEALVTTDFEMQITDCNPAALVMLGGLRRDEVVGHSLREVLPADEDSKLIPIIAGVLDSGVKVTGAETNITPRDRKQPLPILVSCDAIRDVAGNTVGCVAAMADISKLKDAEALRQEFVHMIGHDLRSPISGIVGCLDLLSDPTIGPINELQQNFLNMALASCNNLNSLIGDMLDVYKLEAGQMEMRPRDINLHEMVDLVIKPMLASAAERSLYIRNAVPPDTIVYADPKLSRVLTNLLTNALKFTDVGGIIIAATGQAQQVEVRVEDTGIGIPAGEERNIFDKFYQAQNQKLGKMTGTGLGLSFCRQVIEAHGGRIWAESKGRGSTFTFTLLHHP